MSRRLLAVALAIAALDAGCRTHIEDHCPGCTILSERAPDLPRLRTDAKVTVLLVHGAFGFGPEWDEVVAALQKTPLEFYAWSWGGPWNSPSRATARFAAVLQGLLDAPPRAEHELVVMAHSAGGALIHNAARLVRVPEGKHLRVLSIDAAQANLSAARDRRFSDEALAQTLVVSQRPLGPLPPRVSIEEFLTDDEPAPAERPTDEPGVRRVYLGARVAHDESVPLSALPVIRELTAASP